MDELNADYEAQKEQMAEVAMQIILHAGDARNLIMQALDAIGEGKYEDAEKDLTDAKEELRQAHVFQTSVVQSEAAGTVYPYSLLFTHAQDTVMTIFTELNLAKKMMTLYRKADERISRLENREKE